MEKNYMISILSDVKNFRIRNGYGHEMDVYKVDKDLNVYYRSFLGYGLNMNFEVLDSGDIDVGIMSEDEFRPIYHELWEQFDMELIHV